MPDLPDRLTREEELALELGVTFRQQQRRVEAAGPGGHVDWNEFRQKLGDTYENRLAHTYDVASRNLVKDQARDHEEEAALLLFLLLLAEERQEHSPQEWASHTAGILASHTVSNTQDAVNRARIATETVRLDAERRARFAQQLEATFAKQRAEIIAATETTRAVSQGEGAGRHGIRMVSGRVIEAIWTTEVEKYGTDPPIGPPPPYGVCQICLPLHRKPEREWVAQYPTGPPAHPNCRCYLDWRDITDESQ